MRKRAHRLALCRETPQAIQSSLGKPGGEIPSGDIASLRRQSRECRACPLWRHATQTLFGAGPADAQIMLIGEQPGLYEDREGLPFVGPAGQLLDRALPPAACADLLIASEPAMAGDESDRTQSKLLVLDPRAAIQSVLPPAP